MPKPDDRRQRRGQPAISAMIVASLALLLPSDCEAVAFSAFSQLGQRAMEPGGPGGGIGGTRNTSAQDLFTNSDGELRTIGHMAWDLGSLDPQTLRCSVSGWTVGLGPNIHVYVLINDIMAVTLADRASFRLSGALSFNGGGNSRLQVRRIGGSGITAPGLDAQGRLVITQNNPPEPVSIVGTFDPGDYEIVIDAGSGGDGQFQSDMTLTIFAPPPLCPGDVFEDGIVNTADLTALLTYFGRPVPAYTLGDLNGDGVVNTVDLTLLLLHFGQPCG